MGETRTTDDIGGGDSRHARRHDSDTASKDNAAPKDKARAHGKLQNEAAAAAHEFFPSYLA